MLIIFGIIGAAFALAPPLIFLFVIIRLIRHFDKGWDIYRLPYDKLSDDTSENSEKKDL